MAEVSRSTPDMRVLITGSEGFVGKNLKVRLSEADEFEILTFTRENNTGDLPDLIARADAIVHLAGENRPADVSAFYDVNRGLTESICEAIRASGEKIPIMFSSSSHAGRETAYGKSKQDGERAVEELATDYGNCATIYRFPNIFGKWCRPNYNSVVATFCHNAAHGIDLRVDNPDAQLTLVYIDDVISEIIDWLSSDHSSGGLTWGKVEPEYQTSLGDLAEKISCFASTRRALGIDRVGTGLTRALYSTFISYLEPHDFSYTLTKQADPRGLFVEMLRTPDVGQFSFFTAKPGITRGGHYHHSKTEKFLVVKGQATFHFRHILTSERYELDTSAETPTVVDTVPGWSHDITNTGPDEMIVMLWANEVFDTDNPDTFNSPSV